MDSDRIDLFSERYSDDSLTESDIDELHRFIESEAFSDPDLYAAVLLYGRAAISRDEPLLERLLRQREVAEIDFDASTGTNRWVLQDGSGEQTDCATLDDLLSALDHVVSP